METTTPERPSQEELIASDNLYSDLQQKILFFLPIFSGILSLIGSSLILYVVLSDWRRKLQRVYHRALAAYSFLDVITSVQYALSALVVPKGTVGVWGAAGNWTTCQMSGFFFQFGQSLGLYLAYICVYYVLTIKYRVREEAIAKRIEPFIHTVGFLAPLLMGIVMWKWDMYNPTNINAGHCFINCYPANCLRVEGVDCLRGENYSIWSLFFVGAFWVFFFVIVVTSIMTYRTVRETEGRQRRWSFPTRVFQLEDSSTLPRRTSLVGTLADYSSSFFGSPQRFNPRRNNHNNDRHHRGGGTPRRPVAGENTREAFKQTTLYISSFFITYISFGVIALATLVYDGVEENRTFYFFWVVLVKLFLPSTGVWNFCIYTRPRMATLRKRNPGASRWALLRQVVLRSSAHSKHLHRPPTAAPPLPQPSPASPAAAARPMSYSSSIDDENEDEEFTPELLASSEEFTSTDEESVTHQGDPISFIVREQTHPPPQLEEENSHES